MPKTLRRAIEPAGATAALAAAFVVAYLIPGSTHHATPAAILFRAGVDGVVASLLTVGIVLLYRSLRIVNFAQIALSSAGAILAFDLVELIPGFPALLGLAIGVLMAAGMGAVMHLVFGTRFAKAPRMVLTLATVFAGTFLAGNAKALIDILPFLPPVAQRSSEQNQGGELVQPFLPFSGFHFGVGSFGLSFGFADLLAIGASLAAIAGLGAFLSFTRWGKALRGMAENAERTSLLGISVGMLSLTAWMISAGLGGLSDVLAGSVHAPARVYSSQPADLLIPLTAAVVARMRSIWTATCATVALTVLSSAIQFQLPGQDSLLAAGLFVVLVLGLLLGRRAGSVRTSEEATSWQGTTETRPVPREMASLPLVRAARWGGLGAGLVILAALPFFTSVSNLETVSSICLSAMVVISLVVLTGWAGQASFGQYAFAAVGTLVGGSLATHLQVPFLVAVPAAAAVSAGLALVLGFPALRVPGIFLMVVTFALAIAANALLFDPRYFGWLDPGLVHRPTLFVIDFEESQWMYALCVLMLIGTILAVRNLRRSRFGRLVIAARENPSDLQAAGISVIRTKLVAFGLSGGLAGLAGALLVFQQHGANQPVFAPDQSLLVFQMLIIGGAGTVSGALLGTVLLYGVVFAAQLLPGSGIFVQAIPLLLLYVVPGGLLEAFAAARDGVLRIIAQRNQMIVPALYGDVDPETLRLQLIPLAAPLESGAPHGFRLATSRLRWIGLRPEGAATAPAPGAVEPPPEAIPEPVA